MFVVMNRFPVNPEYAEQFEARLRNRPRQVDQQQGFIQAQLLRPGQPDGVYIVLTVWESKAAFEAWVKADTFTEKHAGRRVLPPDVFRGPNQVEKFEIILDSHISA